jgi:ribosomal-protein-alanine N-acetyltransferase
VAYRVWLDPPAARDASEFIALVKASGDFHRPWSDPPSDEAAFRAILQRNRGADFDFSLLRLLEDDTIVGAFELSGIYRGGFQSAYLGYWVGRPYSGHGYMSEGMRLMFARAFGELRLHRIEANIQPKNKPSLALVKRSGFRKEGFSPRYLKIGGRWRDHERWAILAEEARMRHKGRPAGRR